MKMERLIQDLPIQGAGSGLEVTGLTHDSRRVRPGDLFVAVRGERFDGRDFAAEAARRGATAVLGAGPAPPGFDGVWLEAGEPRRLLGPLAARLYGHPDRELTLVGVTGTNGKSTIVALVAEMLEAAGRPTGRLGTLGYSFGGRTLAGERTTPEAPDLFRALRRMRDAGAEAVAMEVSSHALALARVEGARFDLALFANLTRDHFDFHGGFEPYFEAKRRLFDLLAPGGAAVVNVGDPYGARLARELPDALTYGRGGRVRPGETELDGDGIRGAIRVPGGELAFESPLLGAYNLDNLTGAVAAGVALGLAPEDMAAGIARCAPLPGRLEPVGSGRPFPVYVDFAHTDAALAAAIRSVRGLAGERVIVVFGCGGERDPGKRELMGRVAGELAGRPILTSDNPRREDPDRILAAVEAGLRASGRDYEVIADRRQAIRRAVGLAEPGWAVLLAGKGHEREQVIGERRLPFSDREEALAALEERFGPGTAG